MRDQVKQKEAQIGSDNRLESDRIAKREVAAYAAVPAHTVLHEDYKLPEHETLRKVLKLDPEEHDTQMDEMLKIIQEHGIRNALSVAAKMKNPHLEDDLHRLLVRYIAEGLPDKGMKPPEKIRHGLATVLFEIHPQAYGEGKQEERQQN